MGQNIWSHRPLNLALELDPTTRPTGHLVKDTLCDLDCERPVVCGDGSLRLYGQLASVAWVVEGNKEDKGQISACALLQNISSITCYRVELENIFRYLHHIELAGITSKEVKQWCNNKQVAKDST